MVLDLVEQLLACSLVEQIIVTLNVPEQLNLPANAKIQLVENQQPHGFGANHNVAFKLCHQPFFCIINPDIELTGDPFPSLKDTLENNKAAMVAPLVMSPTGEVDDSIRHFPTIASLFAKLWRGEQGRYTLPDDGTILFPDWVAGMFMLYDSEEFAELGGFDEGYFLYYEDVDICARTHKANKKIVVDLKVSVIHNAQRASRRNFQHMRWHLGSMIRYLSRHPFIPRS